MSYNQNPIGNQFAPDSEEAKREKKIILIWKICYFTYSIAAACLVMYWEFTDQGLPMFFCEWQVRLLEQDSCYVYLNIFLAITVFLIPMFVARAIAQKVTGVKLKIPGSFRQ